MTQPARSTWPETMYALSLTKSGNWSAQRSAMELLCAHAFIQRVKSGPIEMSNRDLAAHLYRSPETGVGSARNVLGRLVDRGVIRELGKGSGSAPSEWDVAHWTRWDVPWRLREASVIDRMIAFSAYEMRAPGEDGARVIVRALTKSARAISSDIASLARVSLEARAGLSTALSTSQLKGSRSARHENSEELLTITTRDSKESLSKEQAEREQKLIDAFKKGALLAKVHGVPLEQLRAIAAMANGSFDEVCRQAADPAGPGYFMDRLALLRQFAEAPYSGDPARSSARHPDRRRQGLESSIRGLELEGMGDGPEAYELREQLATLDACEPKPE